ncbi:unnamed protein product [Paramecium sonneborni]|uniref:Tetratricopeptide repeat protein n=1 Tax=Paramecium sonneborni TaxID=65129 RepID=A0A8S1R142_9CILI|nr:unnamed protein product [Paramecium sonneborni]
MLKKLFTVGIKFVCQKNWEEIKKLLLVECKESKIIKIIQCFMRCLVLYLIDQIAKYYQKQNRILESIKFLDQGIKIDNCSDNFQLLIMKCFYLQNNLGKSLFELKQFREALKYNRLSESYGFLRRKFKNSL